MPIFCSLLHLSLYPYAAFYLYIFKAVCLYWHFCFQFNIIEFILDFPLDLLITSFSKQYEMWLLFLFWYCCLFFKFYTCIQCISPSPQHITLPFHVAAAWFFSTSPLKNNHHHLLSLLTWMRELLWARADRQILALRRRDFPFPSSHSCQSFLSEGRSSWAAAPIGGCWPVCIFCRWLLLWIHKRNGHILCLKDAFYGTFPPPSLTLTFFPLPLPSNDPWVMGGADVIEMSYLGLNILGLLLPVPRPVACLCVNCHLLEKEASHLGEL